MSRSQGIKSASLLVILVLVLPFGSGAQDDRTMNWLSFEQLEDSLERQPKPVFIDFYTDWCTYCRKMDKVVFTKPKVVETLNGAYYAVRFDAETEEVITFGGQTFVNDQTHLFRRPVHQIAQLLALQGGDFAPPTMVLLDEDFNVTARYFEYMDSRRLLEALATD